MIKFKVLIIATVIVGCDINSKISTDESIVNYNAATKYIQTNFLDYKHIYENLENSIVRKAGEKTQEYSIFLLNEWRLDSLLLINNDTTLCIGATYYQNYYRPATDVDAIQIFHGYKLENRWYFKQYVTSVNQRINFQEQRYKAMTFDMLKYLARTAELKSAYEIANDGFLIPKEEYFEDNMTLASKNVSWDQERWHRYIRESSNSYDRKDSDKQLRHINEQMNLPRMKESDAPPITKKQKASIERYQKIFEALNLEHNK